MKVAQIVRTAKRDFRRDGGRPSFLQLNRRRMLAAESEGAGPARVGPGHWNADAQGKARSSWRHPTGLGLNLALYSFENGAKLILEVGGLLNGRTVGENVVPEYEFHRKRISV